MRQLDPLQRPHGRVHFAGEHISAPQARMEGALRFGIRAAKATVVSAEIRESTDQGADRPDITYRYEVDGETYRSSRIAPGAAMQAREAFEAEEIVEDHPEGKEVIAYYNPNDPSEAYLMEERSMTVARRLPLRGPVIVPPNRLRYGR